MSRITKRDLQDLREVRQHLVMDRCSFSAPVEYRHEGNWPERDRAFTEAVARATQLWRDSWIFPTLDRLIRKGEDQ
jgi:hypothetical protein